MLSYPHQAILIQVIQQPSLIRDNLADHHTFALIFGDMTVKTWPLSASLSSPLYFWKYDKYDGEQEKLLLLARVRAMVRDI